MSNEIRNSIPLKNYNSIPQKYGFRKGVCYHILYDLPKMRHFYEKKKN